MLLPMSASAQRNKANAGYSWAFVNDGVWWALGRKEIGPLAVDAPQGRLLSARGKKMNFVAAEQILIETSPFFPQTASTSGGALF